MRLKKFEQYVAETTHNTLSLYHTTANELKWITINLVLLIDGSMFDAFAFPIEFLSFSNEWKWNE